MKVDPIVLSSNGIIGAHCAYDPGNQHYAEIYSLTIAANQPTNSFADIDVGIEKIGDYQEVILAAAREVRAGGLCQTFTQQYELAEADVIHACR